MQMGEKILYNHEGVKRNQRTGEETMIDSQRLEGLGRREKLSRGWPQGVEIGFTRSDFWI